MASCFASLLLCERNRGGAHLAPISGIMGAETAEVSAVHHHREDEGYRLEGCGRCIPCRLGMEGTNPDLRLIMPGNNGSISVDEIRSLQSDIIIRPVYSARRVIIIADGDKMTPQAQNCLLKTLEEPPSYAVILLTASNPEGLLETILSRVQRLNLERYTSEEVGRAVATKYGKLKGSDFIVSYADGIIGTALELGDSEGLLKIRDEALDIALRISKPEKRDIFGFYSFFEENRNSMGWILDVMLLFYRDILVASEVMAGKGALEDIDKLLINSDIKDMILNITPRFTVPKLIRHMDVIEKTRRNLKHNTNYQLTLEMMLMELQEEFREW